MVEDHLLLSLSQRFGVQVLVVIVTVRELLSKAADGLLALGSLMTVCFLVEAIWALVNYLRAIVVALGHCSR